MLEVLVFVLLGISMTQGSLSGSYPYNKPFYDISQIKPLFEKYIADYHKNYTNDRIKEYALRTFRNNVLNINKQNQQEQYAIYDINEFTDMHLLTFHYGFTGLPEVYSPSNITTKCGEFDMDNLKPAPEEFDWRTKDVVSTPKYQDFCRSSWAFSAAANIESQYAIKYHEMLDFAEQNLLDCDTSSNGCEGGLINTAFSYAIDDTLSLEGRYPYEGTDVNGCRPRYGYGIKIAHCNATFEADEELVKQLLYNYGPLSFGMSSIGLKDYAGGILETCGETPVDHAVLLVGYGVEFDVPYWIVKNSWGTGWGHEGYMKMKRGVNVCNMTKYGFSIAVPM